jgi:hypothetical protein
VVASHDEQSGWQQGRSEQSNDMSELEDDRRNGTFLRRCADQAEVRVACRAARRAVATGGARSPSCHHTMCHARARAIGVAG